MRKIVLLFTLFAVFTFASLKSFAVASITGPSSVCVGSTITLSDSTTGGSWTSSSTSVATITSGGVVRGVTAGTTTISYVVTGGAAAGTAVYTVTVNPVPDAIGGSTTSICVGASATFTETTTGGTWSVTPSYVASITSSGVLTGASVGTAFISYTLPTGCYALQYASVNPTPSAGAITGGTTVCAGSTLSLSSSAGSGGVWTSSSASIATVGSSSGIVTGVSAGTVNITYTVTNSCGTSVATLPVVVGAGSVPSAGTITGVATICPGSNDTLVATGATTGGTWTSDATSVFTISSTSGIGRAVASGTAIVTYTVSSSCATSTSTFTVTVGTGGSAGTVRGPASICVGSTGSFTTTSTGGVWSSSASSIVTIDSTTGTATGVASGSATITYTVSGSCGTSTATRGVTITAASSAGTIIGPTSVCVGSTITMTDTGATTGGGGGGGWTISPTSVASISFSGVVTPVSAGTATVTYTVYSSCGAVRTTRTITILATPSAGTITGSSRVCIGYTSTLSSTASGGTWSSSAPSIASVASGTGVVSGLSAGVARITYSVTNSCGTNIATISDTVSAGPATGYITGPSIVCAGSFVTLSDSAGTTGGRWTSSTPTVATIGGTTGIAGGSGAGTTTITYTVTGSCGTVFTTRSLNVTNGSSPGTITGTTTFCGGTSVTLIDSAGTSGGVWTSTNTAIATIDSTSGVATGVSAGTVTISYTVASGCGARTTTRAITILPAANPGTIHGSASSVCTGSTISLFDTSAALVGTWSSSNTGVAIVGIGVVTGISVGTAIISYTVTNSCGTGVATYPVTVIATTVASITGPTSVCPGATITLADSVAGGTWSSLNTSRATINSSGVVTGVAAGIDTINYAITGVCGTVNVTKVITVNALSNAGTISGSSSVCTGTTITLTDSASGGTWSSSNTSLATVTTGGVVRGVAVGTVTISYTVTGVCGAVSATKVITVTTVPATPAAITGTTTVCASSTTTLSDATTGGTWSSSGTSVATVNATTGIVTGVSAGTTLISYTVTNSCGSSFAIATVTVNGLPSLPAIISGTLSVCSGASTTLADATTGGTWSSSNTAIASITSGGVVVGLSGGTVLISYTLTNGCGPTARTASFTVNTVPSAGAITGPSTVCAGSASTYTNTATGGTWSSTAATVATVSPTGVVTGLATGTATIVYTITGACGTATTTQSITVSPAPVAGTISGLSSVCPGSNIVLTNTATGGTWSSTNTALASVSTTGVVYGISAGSVTISYSATNGCGTVAATKAVTVNASSTAGTVTGPSNVCVGLTVTLTDSTASGGTWSSSNTARATVSSTGVVTGVGAGSVVISYSVSGVCGSSTAAKTMTVGPIPVSGTLGGPTSVCTGTTATMTSTSTGGSWLSSDNTIATIVSTTGVLRGVTAGTVTISYYVSSTCATSISTKTVTVANSATPGSLTGLATVCPGASITLTSSGSAGGTWSSSNTTLATVSSTGVVYGIAVGTFTVSYAISNSCGTAVATKNMTVNPLARVSPISGASSVCMGSTTTLTDSVSGGIWLSSNNSIATVSTAGVVTGVVSGTATITYYVSNSCNTASATQTIRVDGRTAGAITGLSTVASGASIILTASTAGGVWTSMIPTLATVSTTGTVTGVSAGIDTIVYTVTNSCGTYLVKKGIVVTARRGEIGATPATIAENGTLKLFPNPSLGAFTLEIPGGESEEATVLITDLAGRLVETRTGTEKTMYFVLSNVASGTYIVTVKTGSDLYSQKIVVE